MWTSAPFLFSLLSAVAAENDACFSIPLNLPDLVKSAKRVAVFSPSKTGSSSMLAFTYKCSRTLDGTSGVIKAMLHCCCQAIYCVGQLDGSNCPRCAEADGPPLTRAGFGMTCDCEVCRCDCSSSHDMAQREAILRQKAHQSIMSQNDKYVTDLSGVPEDKQLELRANSNQISDRNSSGGGFYDRLDMLRTSSREMAEETSKNDADSEEIARLTAASISTVAPSTLSGSDRAKLGQAFGKPSVTVDGHNISSFDSNPTSASRARRNGLNLMSVAAPQPEAQAAQASIEPLVDATANLLLSALRSEFAEARVRKDGTAVTLAQKRIHHVLETKENSKADLRTLGESFVNQTRDGFVDGDSANALLFFFFDVEDLSYPL